MMRRPLAIVTTIAVLCAPSPVRADGLESLPSENTRVAAGPGELFVPILARRFAVPQHSRIIAPAAWERLNVEVKRLQAAETRLTAENRSLRETAKEWQPGWKTLAITLATGIALGAYAGLKF